MKPTYEILFPSPPLDLVIKRYEFFEFGNEISEHKKLLFLPGYENGFLFTFHWDKPLTITNQFVNNEPIPFGNLVPTINTPTFNQGLRNWCGVRVIFKPGTLAKLFKISMKSHVNSIDELKYLLDPELQFIYEALSEQEDSTDRVEIIEGYLFKKFRFESKPKTLFEIVNRYLLNHGYPVSVMELSQVQAKGDRHFRRLLDDEIGLNPQSFINIHRFNQVLQFFNSKPQISLTQTAYDFGYSDQSHFIREFKKFSNLTPKAYLKSIGKGNLISDDFETYFGDGGVLIEENL